jgi:hypothetical protein
MTPSWDSFQTLSIKANDCDVQGLNPKNQEHSYDSHDANDEDSYDPDDDCNYDVLINKAINGWQQPELLAWWGLKMKKKQRSHTGMDTWIHSRSSTPTILYENVRDLHKLMQVHTSTTRQRLTTGDLKWLTAGTFAFASDNLAGGNALPPAFCKPPGVTQNTAGTLSQTAGGNIYHRHFPIRQGHLILPLAQRPSSPAVTLSGFKKKIT